VAAKFERIRPEWLENELRHSVIAFGGGVLISAVALVLIPEGSKQIPSPLVGGVILVSGGIAFFAIERYLGLRRRESPQFVAMLLDYIPETLALGAMFAIGAASAPTLAFLIGLQNLPEGFNAFRELDAQPRSRSVRTLVLMLALMPLGPLVGTIGWVYGAEHSLMLGGIMLFSAGGILYLIFQDVAPQSRLERHWGPALGAVLGFSVGMLGQMLVSVD
jgi:ZIP family zinc transporter